MKRRNAECGKLRRPLKRNKITEGIYGGTILYLKFLLLWAMVILADFILEFRFEFLWPFWLLLRSVYDSFKYQGLAFSVFFICIALTSDMICFFFIPVHWLFFAASTYVWVQYVWHTDKGVCLPTIMLWLLFLYIEAAIRLRDLRHMPFHLDLCRPFAAHCIGYPVVTLGFGLKSYVGYRIRQRKQKDVAKENEFYYQLLLQALPVEQQATSTNSRSQNSSFLNTETVNKTINKTNIQYNQSPEKNKGHNGHATGNTIVSQITTTDINLQNGNIHNDTTHIQQNVTSKNNHRKSMDKNEKQQHHQDEQPAKNNDKKFSHSNGISTVSHQHDVQLIERVNNTVNDYDTHEVEKEKNIKINNSNYTVKNQTNSKLNNTKENRDSINSINNHKKNRQNKNIITDTLNEQNTKQQDEYCQRLLTCRKLESDIKKLKSELQSSKQCEQDLRLQINNLLSCERQVKSDLANLQYDHEQLQNKLQSIMSTRHIDKQTMTTLERRIAEERRQRTVCETSLVSERRARRVAEERLNIQTSQPQLFVRQECTETCKTRRLQFEQEIKNLRREIINKEERCHDLEKDSVHCKDNHGKTEILLGALNALQDKNLHLENSLSAETRIKLDLFSALGEAKRQLEICENHMRQREKEIEILKTKIAQDLAVMTQDTFGQTPTSSTSKLRLNNDVRVGNNNIRTNESPCPGCTVSNLDPNATAYTPKNSLVTSTEA
ncbi:macoilin-1-like isoform X2 [Aphidius gifuensis]|uniref:macoilin-1-like isoform X2 n=1 Tax=Aphidius gifuensis TaxID=684658 RepID=UPI001CDCB676|nr:macoilin-1-like isoform X2 [Aphidius gifuensis]